MRGDAPVILNMRAENLPAAPGDVAIEVLIVNSDVADPLDHIRHWIARVRTVHDPESVLEADGADVHLVGADAETHFNVMFALDHIKGVSDGEHVGATLEGRKATVTKTPEPAVRRNRDQAAT